jgi:hypothetical protein
MVGDENPPDRTKNNALIETGTLKEHQQKQCSIFESVSLPKASSSDQNGVNEAALWLSQNRAAVAGSAIPFLRGKFNLTILEAIEAMKRAHALNHPRGDR